MRTIGIDPGTAILGWGVLDEQGGTLNAVAFGVLKTPSNSTPSERLLVLHQGLQELLHRYQPDDAAVEELFFSRNVTTALAVGQARGVVLLTLALAHVAIYEYKPLTIKQTVAGYGGAQKRQMQEMVRLTLNLSTIPRPTTPPMHWLSLSATPIPHQCCAVLPRPGNQATPAIPHHDDQTCYVLWYDRIPQESSGDRYPLA